MGKFGFLDKFRIPTYNDPRQMEFATVEIDNEKCTGCTLCVGACPARTIIMVEKKARAKTAPDNECAFCGDCAAICRVGAITLKKPFRLTGFYKTLEDGGSSPPRL